jgi:uncharacterized membrane protein
MFSDLLGGLLAEIVGDFLWGGSRRRLEPSPPEGIWNASLGSMSAFLAAVAAAFAVLVLRAEWWQDDDPAYPFILVGSIVLSFVAAWLGVRAFRVTLRRKALAICGLWCSAIAVLCGTAGIVLRLLHIVTQQR